MMMLIIDESYAFVDIPGGKRRLGESSKKGALQETYKETCLHFNENDLEIAFNWKTYIIYKLDI